MTKENLNASSMLETLVKTTDYLKKNDLKTVNDKMKEPIEQIYSGISTLTESFYGCEKLEGNSVLDNLKNSMENEAPLDPFFEEFDKWHTIFKNDLETLEQYPLTLDQDFYKLMLRIHNVSSEDLLANQKAELEKIKTRSEKNYKKLVEFYNSFSYYWGKLNPDDNVYEHFEMCNSELKENADKYTWLYEKLADYRSKKVLYGVLKFWIDLDFEYKNTLVEKNFSEYFDLDILNANSTNGDLNEEVFVDCGAYTGTSILEFTKNYSSYKKIIAYEMVPSIFENLKEELKDYENIEFFNNAISSNGMSKKKAFISNNSKVSTTSLLDPENASLYDEGEEAPNTPDSLVPIEITTIDHEISEPITFIKMDIEGSETDAIKGAKNHIKYDKPKLAIAAYHKYGDLWNIADMLSKLNPNYKFYLRYNGATNGYMASEYVIYAINA